MSVTLLPQGRGRRRGPMPLSDVWLKGDTLSYRVTILKLDCSLTPQADTEVISAKTDVPTATPAPEPAVAPTPEPAATRAKGSGCGAPTEAAAGSLDVTSVGILLGVVGLGFRRRRGRGGF